MATYTLYADGSGTVGGGTVTKFYTAVAALSAGDTLQVFGSAGTFIENNDADFSVADNVTVELPEAGTVIFDHSSRSGLGPVINIKDVTTTFTGHPDAVLLIRLHNDGATQPTYHPAFQLYYTAANPTLNIKNILTVITGGIKGGGSAIRYLGAGTKTANIERVLVNRVFSSIFTDSSATVSSVLNAKNCMFLEGQNCLKLDGHGTYNFTNCLLSGSFLEMIHGNDILANITVNLDNTIMFPGGDSADINMANGGGLTSANSRIYYRYTGNTSVVTSLTTDRGGNLIDGAIIPTKWSNFKRGGMVSLCVDDYSNLDAFQALKTEADARGVKACIALDKTTTVSAADWAQLTTDIGNGHDISVHTRHATNMSTLNAFGIQYGGASSICTMEIAGGILTTTIDGGDDLVLTLSDYASIGALTTAIAAVADYDAVSYQSNGTTKVPVGSSIVMGTAASNRGYTQFAVTSTLADVTAGEDIKTGVYDAQHDSDLYFTEEIGGCIQDIIDGTGYTPTTMVYPSHFQTDAFQVVLEAQGVASGRVKSIETQLWGDGQSSASFNQQYGYPVMAGPSFVCDSELHSETEAVIKAKGAALAYYCNMTGSCITAYGHILTTGTTQAEWGYFIDGILDAGGVIGTMTEAKDYIRTGTRVVDTGVVYYSHDHESQDIALAQALLVDDTYADRAAVSFAAADGRTPPGIDGNPMSNSETSIGPVQSKNTPNHPSKI